MKINIPLDTKHHKYVCHLFLFFFVSNNSKDWEATSLTEFENFFTEDRKPDIFVRKIFGGNMEVEISAF